MSWWWARATGAATKRQDEDATTVDSSFRSVALVVGSTSIVGTSLLDILPLDDTPGGPWKVYAVSRRPLPHWSRPPSKSVTHLHLDLADSAAVAEALAPLTDITHVFYAAWSNHPTEAENREANSAMLRSVLSAVVTNCPALVHVCLQTGRKHYVGPFSVIGKIPAHDPPYTEDMPRLDAGSSQLLLRPRGRALRRRRQLSFSESSDADLIAEHQIWAAVDPHAKNEAFNCSNGDVFKWKRLWPILADSFGVEWAGYEGEASRFNLAQVMADKEAVWAEIIKENGLIVTKLEEVANWWFADAMLGVEFEHLDTMNKSKEHGFLGFRNTVNSFKTWIDKMKVSNIVP
uniref:Uncharacterized protein n=1 Tax=Avena sativa TaxID=4498 RepID=A0ACD5YP58_AVESA